MTDRSDLLVEFLRAASHHSGVRGDTLTSLLDAAHSCLIRGTGAAEIGILVSTLQGDNLLVAHEIELIAAVEVSAFVVLADEISGRTSDEPVVDEDGAAWLPLAGVGSPLAAVRLTPPRRGWRGDDGALAYASAIMDELSSTVLRHWSERQQLDRSSALLEAQRHTHVGCFEWDIVADKVRWSDELFRIFGTQPQSFEPTFEEFLERIHEDDRDAVRTSVYEAYEGRRDYRIEERIVRPDGTIRQLSSWGHVIVDDDTVPVKIIGSCQDVTDFRAAMTELARHERQLAEIQDRRSRALDLNDNVVQGLVTALYALELGQPEMATTALAGTLSAARATIDDLLTTSGKGVDALGLVRKESARSFLVPTAQTTDPVRPESAPSTAIIRVVIADDSNDVRLLTSMILASEPDFEVVAEAANGVEAVALAQVHQPEIVLLDLAMPVLDGLSALPRILAVSPTTQVVVFSGFGQESAAEEALALGAHGYVAKGDVDASLPSTLRSLRADHLRGLQPAATRE